MRCPCRTGSARFSEGGSLSSATRAPSDGAEALGSRPIGRLLWHIGSRTTLSVSAYGVYALTNAWFVARWAGSDALAAVSLAAPVLLVLGALATTVGTGGASLVSRSLGAGDPAAAARAAGNTFLVFWVCAVAVSVAGLLALDPLLTLLGARPGTVTRELTRDYTVILLCGSLVATGFSSLIRAEGRMRFVTLLWLASIAAQMLLDPLLIIGLGLGVRGAALGTVGGQAVGTAMSMAFFLSRRGRPYRLTLRDLLPHGPTLRAVLGSGAPSFIAGTGGTLLAVLANNVLAATAGVTALAAHALCTRIQTFAAMPQLGLSQALQPVTGYNHGRGRPDRVRLARVIALRACLGYGVAAALAVAVAAPSLVAAFTGEPATASTAVTALRIVAAGLVLGGVAPLAAAYHQSLGRPAPAYALTAGTLFLVKVPLVLVAGAAGGAIGVWLGLAAGETVCGLLALALLVRPERRAPARPTSAAAGPA